MSYEKEGGKGRKKEAHRISSALFKRKKNLHQRGVKTGGEKRKRTPGVLHFSFSEKKRKKERNRQRHTSSITKHTEGKGRAVGRGGKKRRGRKKKYIVQNQPSHINHH